MPLLNRKAQVCVVIEGTEGTFATMAAASATMLVYDPKFDDSPDLFERNPCRSTLSKLAKVVGKEAGGASWKTELKGSGSVATRPAWDAAIRCCGFSSAALSTITVSGMTGTFYPGEAFSAGAVTGKIAQRHNGATLLYYVPTAGALAAAATLTGGTSGAICVAAGSPATAKGFAYWPISASVPSASVGVYKDGLLKKAAGARGNVKISAKVAEPAFLEFNFEGVYEGVADVALLTVTYESTVPVAFKSVTTYMDSLDVVYSQFGLDAANTLTPRESAAASKGILSVMITDRDPKLTADPEMVLVASKDFHGRFHSQAAGYFSAQWGSVAGNIIGVGSPRIHYEGIGEGDRGGIQTADLEFGCKAATVSSGDDEVMIMVR